MILSLDMYLSFNFIIVFFVALLFLPLLFELGFISLESILFEDRIILYLLPRISYLCIELVFVIFNNL